LRIRSNARGNAFNSSIEFSSAVKTIPGAKYSLSMQTMINCGQIGCETAGDKIAVKIIHGNSGEFSEEYSVAGGSLDNRWYNKYFVFVAKSDSIRVK
jgi:hypothetical protein